MSDASLAEIMDALADQLDSALSSSVEGIQIEPRLVFNPTPPCLDVYPADPFEEQSAFGIGSREATFVVRARVATADQVAGQELLLELMDRRNGSSVLAAISSDPTFGGVVDDSRVEGPSGFIVYADTGQNGNLLGCEWRTVVVLG